jgi:hypothetical protein
MADAVPRLDRRSAPQCECGLPVPHNPHERGCPVQAGASLAELPTEAKTESFLVSFVEPQCGHPIPVHPFERTSSSLSRPHFSQ